MVQSKLMYTYVRFEVLMTVTEDNCLLEYGVLYFGRQIAPALKMEAVGCFETLVTIYQIMRPDIPEESKLDMN
jgi:hypothetical protein